MAASRIAVELEKLNKERVQEAIDVQRLRDLSQRNQEANMAEEKKTKTKAKPKAKGKDPLGRVGLVRAVRKTSKK